MKGLGTWSSLANTSSSLYKGHLFLLLLVLFLHTPGQVVHGKVVIALVLPHGNYTYVHYVSCLASK